MVYNPLIVDRLFDIAKNTIPVARARVVAGIVHKKLHSPIIATNSLKTHPFQAKYGKNEQSIHLHAEVSVICRALKILSVEELEKSELYIVRARKIKGKWVHGIAKPCLGCTRCITTFNLSSVYYTDDEQTSSKIAS